LFGSLCGQIQLIKVGTLNFFSYFLISRHGFVRIIDHKSTSPFEIERFFKAVSRRQIKTTPLALTNAVMTHNDDFFSGSSVSIHSSNLVKGRSSASSPRATRIPAARARRKPESSPAFSRSTCLSAN
jgi:hypothetical protein